MWDNMLKALGVVLIVEGLWPFISPARWRTLLLRVAAMDDRILRLSAVVSIVIGLVLLQIF
jgi:uncharacterized protein YjeT (DUF2065 family)